MIKIPTIRKFFTFKQYEEALQKFAFKHALEVFTALDKAPEPTKEKHHYSWGDYETVVSQDFNLKAEGPHIKKAEAYPYNFDFRRKTITVNYKHYGAPDHWHFVLEEKIYSDSPHNSKLHYDVASDATKADKQKQIDLINSFVDKLMEGIEPEQRFNLKKFSKLRAKVKAVAS